ncbi:MAG TPA: hypothetical protein VD791_08185, partial [Burkholderiales bacterium]|nr:hypothetical protein [Burkholderiales bacterium]
GKLRAERCQARLPKRNTQWLDLVQAVAVRDSARMTALASAMLEEADAEAKTYLVHAAMLGALARDRSDEAVAIWRAHGEKLHNGTVPLALDTRVLVALAHMNPMQQAGLTR